MEDRTAIVLGALAGAVVGGAFGYLYLSDDGRRLREDFEPEVAELIAELKRTWEVAEQVREAIRDGWSAAPGAATPTPPADG